MINVRFWLLVWCGWSLWAHAQDPAEPTEAQQQERLAKIQAAAQSLHYREGTATWKDGMATVQLTPEFRYLDANDAHILLSDIWGNPKSDKLLGVLVPVGFDPMNEQAWAVVVTYDESGYVKDDEAAKLDYGKLLKEMQDGTQAENEERQKAGYPPIQLVGWATEPHYDKATHKIYWAKDLRFGAGSQEDTLNYCIRILGRRGVLELNAVAAMQQLSTVEQATPAILSMVNFSEGHRYADFNASTDKVAAIGIAALIAGGVLAKTGLLKGLLIALLAAKKVIIVGAIAISAWVKKLLFGKKAESIQRQEE